MALKHTQNLKLNQKLLPQQILLMKLLQLPTLALEERIKEELEVNPALDSNPEKVNEDPYGEGWMVKVSVNGGVSDLLSAAQYKELIGK